MDPMKKFVSLMLAGLMAASLFALTACGGGDSSSTAPTSSPQSVSEPEPEVADPAYLTGLEKGEGYVDGRRVTAVMVNNIVDCRPQHGLSSADTLVEIVTEGGITRFMALFENYEAIPKLGPVRSARDQFFRLMYPSEAFYVHIGASVFQTDWKTRLGYDEMRDFNGDSTGVADWEDRPGYDQEHRAYTYGEYITEHIAAVGADPNYEYVGTFLPFQDYTEPARAVDSAEMANVAVMHSDSYGSSFDYDAASGLYKMNQYNYTVGAFEPSIDQNNEEQVSFSNLLILFTSITPYEGSYVPWVDYTGGTGYYFNGGRFEKLSWEKGEPQENIRLFNEAGEELKMNPGKSYVGVVGNEMQADFEAALPAAAEDTSGAADGSASSVEP